MAASDVKRVTGGSEGSYRGPYNGWSDHQRKEFLKVYFHAQKKAGLNTYVKHVQTIRSPSIQTPYHQRQNQETLQVGYNWIILQSYLPWIWKKMYPMAFIQATWVTCVLSKAVKLYICDTAQWDRTFAAFLAKLEHGYIRVKPSRKVVPYVCIRHLFEGTVYLLWHYYSPFFCKALRCPSPALRIPIHKGTIPIISAAVIFKWVWATTLIWCEFDNVNNCYFYYYSLIIIHLIDL